MTRYGIALGAVVVPFALAMGSAEAAFINGSVSMSNDGLTLPSPPSNSIVSQLTSITQGTPVLAPPCSGNFTTAAPACNLTPAPTASTFATTATSGTVYTYGGFTFTISSITGIVRTALVVNPTTGLGTDSLALMINGIVSGNGFQNTSFVGAWTANGTCTGTAPNTCTGNLTGSWSVSLTALGMVTTSTPEPTSLALLGTALVGFGLVRRRRKAA